MVLKRANVDMPPRMRSRATPRSLCATTLTNMPVRGAPARSRAHATRSASAPTPSSTRSAWRAAASTFGPVAATSTATGASSLGSQCRRLSSGASARPSVSRVRVPAWPKRARSSNAMRLAAQVRPHDLDIGLEVADRRGSKTDVREGRVAAADAERCASTRHDVHACDCGRRSSRVTRRGVRDPGAELQGRRNAGGQRERDVRIT